MSRPIEYNFEVMKPKIEEYLASCVDTVEEFHKTRGEKSDSFDRILRVKIPTIEGLCLVLDIAKDTCYAWEKLYPEFSYDIDRLRKLQASRLVEGGLSGSYNPTIAKVLLTKHGYREGIDNTTNDKDLPTPLLHAIRNNPSNAETNQTE